MPTFAAILSVLVGASLIVKFNGATIFWCVIGAVLAAVSIGIGIRVWNDAGTPKTFIGWLGGAVLMLSVGAGIYSLECIVGILFHPELSFLEAGLRTGPAGGICTVAVTACVVLFAMGGAVYRATEWLMKEMGREPNE